MKLLKLIERKGREFLLEFLRLVLKPAQINKHKIKKIKNVIIVRIDERLGNLVLITPVIKSFLKNNIKVTVIAASVFSKLLYTINNIRIIEFNKKKLFNPIYLLKYILFLRKEKYDLLFDASNPNEMSTLTFFVILLLKARYKIGFLRKNSDLILNLCVNRPEKEIHIVEYYKILFKTLGLKYYLDPRISLPTEIKRRYLNLKKEFKNKTLIAVHPGGRGNKQWKIERFLKLLRMIRKSYPEYAFLIILGPSEKDLIKIFQSQGYRVILPVDVLDLSAYFSICKIFIGNDSGPMHLAAALGLNVLAIFKDTARAVFRPLSKRYKILSAHRVNSISANLAFNAFVSLLHNSEKA